MPEHASVTTTIEAPPQRCFEAAVDVEHYPEWAPGISSVAVLDHDEGGRPIRVEFVAEAIGRRTRYILAYDHSEAPVRLSWSLVEGDLTRRLEGAYTFRAAPDAADGEVTEVCYELDIELAVPLPGFVKRRAETKILQAALPRLKARVEALQAG
jgi:ribosome-associated toxin RatA of RatAB toxin-antitoxin module